MNPSSKVSSISASSLFVLGEELISKRKRMKKREIVKKKSTKEMEEVKEENGGHE